MTAAQKVDPDLAAEAKQLEAAKGEVLEQQEVAKGEVVDDGPGPSVREKILTWHGFDLVLPAKLPAYFMLDAFEAQATGDEVVLARAIWQIVGNQWPALRASLVEQNLTADDAALEDLVGLILGEYGMSPGERSASPDSSVNGSGN